MKDAKLVWSDDKGDLRKCKNTKQDANVNLNDICLKIRRLTAGKGRTVIEITGLPANETWNKSLASDLKKSLGVGGTFKQGKIELNLDHVEKVTTLLDKKMIAWKKTGG